MSETPIKVGDKYYLVGKGFFACSITEYKEVGKDKDNIKLERINSDNFKIFETRIEAYAYIVDKWRGL